MSFVTGTNLWLPDLKHKTVFLLFGLTLEGLECLGSFEDSKDAYYAAADTLGGIVVPGTEVVHKDQPRAIGAE